MSLDLDQYHAIQMLICKLTMDANFCELHAPTSLMCFPISSGGSRRVKKGRGLRALALLCRKDIILYGVLAMEMPYVYHSCLGFKSKTSSASMKA